MTHRFGLALAAPALLVLAVFFALPVLAIAIDAFAGGGGAFARIIAAPRFGQSLLGSVLLMLVAVTLSTTVGVGVALHLSRLPERQRMLLAFVIALPLTFSGLIVAYGFILTYGRAGFVTQLLAALGFDAATIGRALFTPTGLAFASSYYLIPRVVMGLLPIFVNFDGAQLAAAESLGATKAQAFAQVMLPQIAGPLIGTACLVGAVVFGAYGTAIALVGTNLDILPLQLYTLVSDSGADFPAAAALALLITAACSMIMATGEWLGSRHERHL